MFLQDQLLFVIFLKKLNIRSFYALDLITTFKLTVVYHMKTNLWGKFKECFFSSCSLGLSHSPEDLCLPTSVYCFELFYYPPCLI